MKKIYLFYLVSFIFFSYKTNEGRTKVGTKPPNIIFLLTDDQRFDALGIMGNNIVQTPNLDQLAKDGHLFKNTFVTTSICSTSRASIFSGQYARRHAFRNYTIQI